MQGFADEFTGMLPGSGIISQLSDCWGGLSGTRPALLAPAEKFGGIDFEDFRELFEHVDSRGVLFPLQHSDIVAVDAGTISKLLLRQPLGMPDAAQISRDDLAQPHAARQPQPLI